jgi:hypothetical protein
VLEECAKLGMRNAADGREQSGEVVDLSDGRGDDAALAAVEGDWRHHVGCTDCAAEQSAVARQTRGNQRFLNDWPLVMGSEYSIHLTLHSSVNWFMCAADVFRLLMRALHCSARELFLKVASLGLHF